MHIVPQIAREASGPSYSVPRLCQALAGLGHDVELKCLAASRDVPGVNLTVHHQWPILRRFEVSTELAMAIRPVARSADVIHNHSLWSMVNVAAACLVPGHHARLVTSPRGTLSPSALARRARVKRALWVLQKRALERADLLHATSDAEYADIRRVGLRAPVAVIPNGIDLPAVHSRRMQQDERILLYLGRIHPIKGLDELLLAWRELEGPYPQWRLVIAGPGEAGHVRAVKDLAAKLQLKRAFFIGPLYGEEKSQAYFSADLYVLPTHTENFGMTVAEALSHGCPAVVTHGAPWSGLVTEKCGWWISRDVETLVRTLGVAMTQPAGSLQAMGMSGRAWMEREFGWKRIAQQMEVAYRWVIEGGVRPSHVHVD